MGAPPADGVKSAMPYQITLDWRPAGYSLENATEGQPVRVVVREFTSSEDGELFISRLEGFPSELLGRLPANAGVRPSSVDHMLAIIRPDLRTDVYVNECNVVAMIRAARDLRAGEPVREDDIVDITTLKLQGVEVPAEAAVVCVLSAGWRKGLFFDLTPLGPGQPAREYDLWKVLGSYFAYLTNQSVFRLDESQWGLLSQQGWFPFVSLPKRVLRQVLSSVRSGSSVDMHLKSIVQAIRSMAPQMRERWAEAALLQPHLPLLQHALDLFLKDDYISCTAILYPRIEGIMRSMHAACDWASSLRPARLSMAAVAPWVDRVHQYSWLLPQRFTRYLEEVYFADFAPGQSAPLSRHSVAHGVAAPEDFNQKQACIGLLIVDQLWFLLPLPQPPSAGGADIAP